MTSKRLLSCACVPRALVLLLAWMLIAPAEAQIVNIVIPAGSPEDQATAAIANEGDAQKRVAMWNDFLQKFAGNQMAVAYGNLQLAQQYQTSGELQQALAAGEKAYAALPNNLDILMALASIAQQAKDNGKAVRYAAAGGALVNGLGKQAKPAEMSDSQFAAETERARAGVQQQYDFLEAAGYNAIAAEPNAKARMGYVEQFMAGFPKSRYGEAVAQYAIMALQQMNDPARLAAFGDKALAANPDSVATLALLASAFAEEPSGAHLAKASEYARRAIELSKDKTSEPQQAMLAGVAHSALGYTLLRQDGLTNPHPGPKTASAIPELRQASAMLKGDPGAYSNALYWLGFAYAKTSKLTEARAVLSEAAGIQGPYQQLARDLLAKVNSARAKAR